MMLKHPYQETLGYRIYDGYMKFTGGNFIAAFLLMTVAVSLIADPACAAPGQNQSVGMDMDGKLEPTDFTQASTKEFAQNLGLSFTAVRVIGTVIIAGGLVMTAIRYRSEDQAQRAQELLIRGALALFIVNILPTIIRFVTGAFYTGM